MFPAFIFALVTSFWGSIPPGPSNLAILHTVLNKNTRSGVWMALGACLPELPYAFIAIVAVKYVNEFKTIALLFESITAVVLIVAGVFVTFIQKQKNVDLEKSVDAEKLVISPFWKGAIIGSLNPMIVGFWLVTAEVAAKTGTLDLQSHSSIISFVLGAAIGALILLFLVVFFTKKIKQKLTNNVTTYLNKAIGITFIVLGILQTYKFCTHYF